MTTKPKKQKERLKKLEALLFVSPKPLSLRKISHLLGLDLTEIEPLIKELNNFYEQTDRAFQIYTTANGFQFRPNAEFSGLLSQIEEFKTQKLSMRNLETLSLIAYKQPITRGEMEQIRSVDCGYSLNSLLEKNLIRVVGRSEKPGQPILYGTSPFFLEVFNLKSLDDLPQEQEFK